MKFKSKHLIIFTAIILSLIICVKFIVGYTGLENESKYIQNCVITIENTALNYDLHYSNNQLIEKCEHELYGKQLGWGILIGMLSGILILMFFIKLTK